MAYITKQTPYGTYEVFKDGERVATTTKDLADRYASQAPVESPEAMAERVARQGEPGFDVYGNPVAGGAPASSIVDRYKTDRANIADTYDDVAKPDQAAILEQSRQRAQAAINAINTKFATIEAQDREVADLMNRERRAANVLSGLSGSRTGSVRTIETAKEGAGIIARTAAQKEAEIASILSDAEARGTEEFLNERNAYISQQKDKLQAEQGLDEKIKTQAQSEIQRLAANNPDFNEWKTKNPGLLNQYMKELGLTEDGLKDLFLSQIPKDKLLSEKGEILTLADGRTVSRFWYTGPDGKPKYQDVEIPKTESTTGKKIKSTRLTDEGVQILYEDGTYEFKGGGPAGVGGGGTKRFTQTQLNDGAANASVDYDTFLSYNDDTKNVFINGDIKGTKKILSDALEGGESVDDVLKTLSDLNLPQAAEDYFKKYIDSVKGDFAPLTPEQQKETFSSTLSDLKTQGYNRDEAYDAVINELTDGGKTTIPEEWEKTIKDSLAEVYGRTIWQKIWPGGR